MAASTHQVLCTIRAVAVTDQDKEATREAHHPEEEIPGF